MSGLISTSNKKISYEEWIDIVKTKSIWDIKDIKESNEYWDYDSLREFINRDDVISGVEMKYIPERLLNEKKVIELLVIKATEDKDHGWISRISLENFTTIDFKLIVELVKNSRYSLEKVQDAFYGEYKKQIQEASIESFPMNLKFIEHKEQTQLLCDKAFNSNKWSLQFFNPIFIKNNHIEEALEYEPRVLLNIDNFVLDKDFFISGLKKGHHLLNHVPSFILDQDIIETAIKYKPEMTIQCLPKDLLTKEIIIKCFESFNETFQPNLKFHIKYDESGKLDEHSKQACRIFDLRGSVECIPLEFLDTEFIDKLTSLRPDIGSLLKSRIYNIQCNQYNYADYEDYEDYADYEDYEDYVEFLLEETTVQNNI